ncbi:MAG: outer membrane beta-barrel protein [Elusimicrobiaceae bacterium]|nr:outer membrane beta-barrel protein [Elusimicrobiaceae bacterium]
MRKLFFLSSLLCVTVYCSGQIYQAGQIVTKPGYSLWEVAAGWTGASGEVSLKNGSTSTHGQHGITLRGLYSVSRYFSIGLEGTLFSSQKIAPLINKYYATEGGIRVQYHLTPDTHPRVYLTAAAGETFYKFSYVSPYQDYKNTQKIPYLSLGAGVDVSLWKNLFAAAEVQAVYHTKTNLDLFYELSKRWEAQGRLLIGMRF